ncbi:uncharacterized protein F4812DRAFT_410724 [Daldinia caldariorum]|uniref:uncharacterized protein n=1 Tax=Daldinia caldariorum TaxID=326644 RepID=UPI0020077DAD|nr:uncharacterized protein F4812DRAFT_410724 [Daldinia caldariorum]KAI1472876.1 hypothetical protein F4812DRAFT_410724 [Daldinia caldariorum]
MTSAEPLIFYPAYCFHLSPTINKWCPLRAIDIHGLEGRPGFEGDNVFFSLNHPIRWVRIVGVVVAIDQYYSYRNYTVDDSTGACIECSITTPKPADSRLGNDAENPVPDPYSEIDVGTVIEVKGSTHVFRGQKQIKVQKLQRVMSTSQEVQFWNKIRDFRKDVLSKPWALERKEVRRCKKQYMADVESMERKKKRKENRLAVEKHKRELEPEDKGRETSKHAKQESLVKLEARSSHTKGQYSALGL